MEQIEQIKVTRQIVSESGVTFIVFGNANNEERYIQIEDFESSMVSFHYSVFAECSHIRTLYQIFNTFLKSSGYTLCECQIEDYNDNLGYCKISISKNNKIIYFMCSIIDGVILALNNNAPLLCTASAWANMELLTASENH